MTNCDFLKGVAGKSVLSMVRGGEVLRYGSWARLFKEPIRRRTVGEAGKLFKSGHIINTYI